MSQLKQITRAAGILLIGFGVMQPVSALTMPLCEDGLGNLESGCLSDGNDSKTAVENAILGATGSSVDIMLYGKSDDDPELFSITGILGGSITDNLEGTWDVLDNTISIAYLTVKAGNFFTLYDVQGANSGTWTTEGILNNGGQQPTLSHLSFWTVDEPVQVPEPGTIALLGLGLVGLTLARRKNRTS